MISIVFSVGWLGILPKKVLIEITYTAHTDANRYLRIQHVRSIAVISRSIEKVDTGDIRYFSQLLSTT